MRIGLGLQELGDLLEQPLLAILATRTADDRTLLSPVWHGWVDGGFLIPVDVGDRKLVHIKRRPQVTILVAEHRLPYRGMEVTGLARATSTPYGPTLRQLARRYLGDADNERYPDSLPGVIVRIEARWLRTWDFADGL